MALGALLLFLHYCLSLLPPFLLSPPDGVWSASVILALLSVLPSTSPSLSARLRLGALLIFLHHSVFPFSFRSFSARWRMWAFIILVVLSVLSFTLLPLHKMAIGALLLFLHQFESLLPPPLSSPLDGVWGTSVIPPLLSVFLYTVLSLQARWRFFLYYVSFCRSSLPSSVDFVWVAFVIFSLLSLRYPLLLLFR